MIYSIILLKGRVWLLATQTGQVGGKESLLYFRCWQLVGEVRRLFKPTHGPGRDKSCNRQKGLRNSTVNFNSHLEAGHPGSHQRHPGCFKYN